MAWGVISYALAIVGAECQLHLTCIHEVEDVFCGKYDAVFHVVIVDAEQVLIFVAHGECASGAGGECHATLLLSTTYACDVHLALLLGLCRLHVGYQSHAAALLLVEEVDAITHGIHYLHEVFTQLWIVVVGVATVEIAHLIAILALRLCSILAIPCLEALA